MKSLGIIGFGQFGQFMAKHLKQHFDLVVYDEVNRQKECDALGVRFAALDEVASLEVVILAVPVQYLESVLLKIKDKAREGALFIDVSSVKIRPIELMKKHLPQNVRKLGVHPLFGPQSGKNGIQGLKIVVCPNGDDDLISNLKLFLESSFGLEVLVKTAEEHDEEMAYVQALSHFLAKALVQMDLKRFDMDTVAYNRMHDVMDLIGSDSMDLFKTIQNENPYAEGVRQDFMKAFHDLEGGLKL